MTAFLRHTDPSMKPVYADIYTVAVPQWSKDNRPHVVSLFSKPIGHANNLYDAMFQATKLADADDHKLWKKELASCRRVVDLDRVEYDGRKYSVPITVYAC